MRLGGGHRRNHQTIKKRYLMEKGCVVVRRIFLFEAAFFLIKFKLFPECDARHTLKYLLIFFYTKQTRR